MRQMTGRMGTDEVRQCYDDMAQNWRLLGIVDAMLLINRLRKRQFSTVEGDVLDVACGTGENFEYLSRASTVTAIDLSPEMVVEARRRARQMQEDIAILVGDAQRMPFADDTFDVVVSALSSCTFPDHVAAFREMARVVRPGGRILLVEHGRSSVGWIGDRQDRNIERVYRRSACRNNRDVTAELAESGLNVVDHRRSHLGMLHRVSIDVARAGCSA